MNIFELYTKLVGYLEDELKVYRHLLDLVRREKEILVAANIDELNENNKAKDAMLMKLRNLDRVREKAARDLAQAVNCDMERPRLLEIANNLESEQAERLRSLHAALDLIIQRVKELNKKNEVLAKSALKNIQGAMDAIKTTLGAAPTYHKQGEKSQGPVEAGQFVSREA